ncbi:MAG TPA: glucuronate isomerase [Phnomibacter sp.]|nr:glucuronate isomerase [Phnomibacter sp.]
MKQFLDEDFLLYTPTAVSLYHQHAKPQPIVDYHNHLSPAFIAKNHSFKNITEIWLQGDHYKWRAMRAHGIDEYFITGDANPQEKFNAWAQTVPFTMRNPLYHWTHLELQRYFGITDLLDETTASQIYQHCTAALQTPAYSTVNLLLRMHVEVLCTTDDPCDNLEYHQSIRQQGLPLKVLPTFRPDAAIAIENPATWNMWVNKLGQLTNTNTYNFSQFIDALRMRHDYFAQHGCLLSDHGLERMYFANYTPQQIEEYYDMLRAGRTLEAEEAERFKTAVLYQLALLDHDKGWTAQWHIGALRNNNARLQMLLGADAGADSISDQATAGKLAEFLNKLESTNQLSKTILYNLNPAYNEVSATMAGNFQGGGIPGKVQYGSGWWFLDQKDGMEKQINTLSNMGLLSHFVGMLTDSRSFLSFPRHEYFRRILSNIIGSEVERGELPPTQLPRIGKMIENICYHNAKNYLGF